MPDVIIKGMEMPSGCRACKLNNDTICALINGCVYDETDGSTRRPDCPLRPAPEWIPCSERLPKKSGQYYVSGGEKVWICEFLIIPNFIGGWCNDASNPVVQAWMPSPEPYREDGDEE